VVLNKTNIERIRTNEVHTSSSRILIQQKATSKSPPHLQLSLLNYKFRPSFLRLSWHKPGNSSVIISVIVNSSLT